MKGMFGVALKIPRYLSNSLEFNYRIQMSPLRKRGPSFKIFPLLLRMGPRFRRDDQKEKHHYLKITIFILLTTTHLAAATPRTSLANFEKDLQHMTKSSTVAIKAGSFVDRLAEKRRQKEALEQALARAKQEVDTLRQEVDQLQSLELEADRQLTEQQNLLKERVRDVEMVSTQLLVARETVQPVTKLDV